MRRTQHSNCAAHTTQQRHALSTTTSKLAAQRLLSMTVSALRAQQAAQGTSATAELCAQGQGNLQRRTAMAKQTLCQKSSSAGQKCHLCVAGPENNKPRSSTAQHHIPNDAAEQHHAKHLPHITLPLVLCKHSMLCTSLGPTLPEGTTEQHPDSCHVSHAQLHIL